MRAPAAGQLQSNRKSHVPHRHTLPPLTNPALTDDDRDACSSAPPRGGRPDAAAGNSTQKATRGCSDLCRRRAGACIPNDGAPPHVDQRQTPWRDELALVGAVLSAARPRGSRASAPWRGKNPGSSLPLVGRLQAGADRSLPPPVPAGRELGCRGRDTRDAWPEISPRRRAARTGCGRLPRLRRHGRELPAAARRGATSSSASAGW